MKEWEKELEKQGISEKKIEEVVNGKKKDAQELLQDKEKTEKLLALAEKTCERLSNVPVVGQVFADLPILCSMVKDYMDGVYKEIPLATIITIVAGIIYLVSPVDLIADLLPVVGQIDDVAVLSFVLMGAHNDIKSYEEWKKKEVS